MLKIWDGMKSLNQKAVDVVGRCKVAALAVCAAAVFGAQQVYAQSTVTLPQPLGEGVTMGDYIAAGIASLGGIVAVAVGGYTAFSLVWIGCRWLKKAAGV